MRKDLSWLGSYGTRGVGYDVDQLMLEISRELGLTRDWPVAIIGVGMAGVVCARTLRQAGHNVTLFEKSRPDPAGISAMAKLMAAAKNRFLILAD